MKPMDIRASQCIGVRRSLEPRPSHKLSVGLKIAVAFLLLGSAAASNAQDEQFSAIQVTPTLRRHVMLRLPAGFLHPACGGPCRNWK